MTDGVELLGSCDDGNGVQFKLNSVDHPVCINDIFLGKSIV